MSPETTICCAIFVIFISVSFCQTPFNMLIILEQSELSKVKLFNDIISNAQKIFRNNHVNVKFDYALVDRENIEESYQALCATAFRGVSLILDLTWTGWIRVRKLAETSGIMYLRGQPIINSYVQAMDDILVMKNATDCALIFEHEIELNQTLYYLIGSSIIRLVVIDQFSPATVTETGSMRPLPSYYVIYASRNKMKELFKTAINGGLVNRDGVWNLVFTDDRDQQLSYFSENLNLNVSVNVLTMKTTVCCQLIGNKSCECPHNFRIFPEYMRNMINLIVSVINEIDAIEEMPLPKSILCDQSNSTEMNTFTTSDATNNTNSVHIFEQYMKMTLSSNNSLIYLEKQKLLTYHPEIIIRAIKNGKSQRLGEWNRDKKVVPEHGKTIEAARRYLRVGTAESVPWAYIKRDESTDEPIRRNDGTEIWEGYCVDLIEKLAKEMDFDYDLVIPKEGTFGNKKPNGQWDGLIGDLAKGETDIAVAALTMTSDREEVIDFVAPYFDQSGILITIRKPVRKTSLFKFMTVLKPEVWLSIVGALTLTGFMIWILDKYSPYSARNNKELYPYPCREFTLKESFWFALTSFTPQGGGEAPKALSSRTLVAAYWLFVVLMLATFTANLAAFLTVERMQSPVQSLEELARQSRINYTVLKNSSIHQYFINMQKAEEKLYEVWKTITLNSSSDQIEYRVWDYPIKEQYGHILQAIEQVGPVLTIEEGFRKVDESETAEFAFIHDSAQIKYEVTRNCNLTEVGEVFAEQPYAIAVQQGSHLQEEISRKILDFQKDRYFEHLVSKYWNTTKQSCPNNDENEGITLESLGGVFIATLIGLLLAMVTLAGEVIYYRRKNVIIGEKQKPQVKETEDKIENEKIMIQKLASKLKLRPAPVVAFDDNPSKTRPQISHISVYPRPFPFQE